MVSDSRRARNEGTRSLAAKVALQGGRVGKSVFIANWEPYCDDPISVDRRITSREAVKGRTLGATKIRDEISAMEVSVKVPCRKCPKCLQFRQMRWRQAAITEIDQANRTWFITLTFSPQHLSWLLQDARSSEPRDIERSAYKRVQLFFKRLRKGHMPRNLGVKRLIIRRKKDDPPLRRIGFRYLAVFERGKENGRVHYHILLHENGTRPLLKMLIEAQWPSFSSSRLVHSGEAGGTASYVTKYATKSLDMRIRASNLYGQLSLPQKTKFFGELKSLF